MKPLCLTVTVDTEALLDLLIHAIEQGTAQCTQAFEKCAEQRATEEKVIAVPVTTITQSPAQPATAEKTPASEKLLDAKAVAQLLGVSARTVWRLNDSGQMPRPVRLGSIVRWKSDEIDRWIEAGCPKVEQRGATRRR